MSYDLRNLSDTVYAKTAGRRRRCTVGRPIIPWQNGGRTWTFDHTWKGGARCLNCGKTVAEIREPRPITLHQALKGN